MHLYTLRPAREADLPFLRALRAQSMREHLEELVNPSTWITNPGLAMQKFNQLRDVLLSETETYKSALRSPTEYRGHQGSKPSMPTDMSNDPLGLRS